MTSTLTTKNLLIGFVSLIFGLGVGIAVSPKGNVVDTPLNNFDTLFCGFDIDCNDKTKQAIVYKYTNEISYGRFQSIIFNSTKKDAKVIGIEYTISEYEYKQLPKNEQSYWHPNKDNINLGLLAIVPIGFMNVNTVKESSLLYQLRTSWSKTYHLWPDITLKVPQGEPTLQWGADKDTHVGLDLIKTRDKDLDIDTNAIRDKRNFRTSKRTAR